MENEDRTRWPILSLSSSPPDAEAASAITAVLPTQEPKEEEGDQVAEGDGPILKLQVGERHFITTIATLTSESGFFASMFSDRWRSRNNKQADGSYFVDADPEFFEHILRYLRHGQLPLFYTNGQGHDWGRYAALLGEARYFQVERLVTWIEKERYLDAVKIQRTVQEIEGLEELDQTTLANEEIEYQSYQATKQTYICPRGVDVHRGNPLACGRLCERVRGGAEPEYEKQPIWKTLMIRKKVVFNHKLWDEV